MRNGRWPGTWKVCCDVCGFNFPSDEIRDRWDGLKVCEDDWEIKHPQLNIRIHPEKIAPPFVRPEPADVFINVCSLWGTSAYAGLAEAGCARANNTQLTYSFLINLKNATEEPIA